MNPTLYCAAIIVGIIIILVALYMGSLCNSYPGLDLNHDELSEAIDKYNSTADMLFKSTLLLIFGIAVLIGGICGYFWTKETTV